MSLPGFSRISGPSQPFGRAATLFQDHLGLDAIVAYTDGALSLTAFQRVAAHIARCAPCADEVDEQAVARRQLRSAACPTIPGDLIRSLLSIPLALPIERHPNQPGR